MKQKTKETSKKLVEEKKKIKSEHSRDKIKDKSKKCSSKTGIVSIKKEKEDKEKLSHTKISKTISVEKKRKVVKEKLVEKKPGLKKKKYKPVIEEVEPSPTIKQSIPEPSVPIAPLIKKEVIPKLKIKLELRDGITPQEISLKINKPVTEIITELMKLGAITSATQKITDHDTIILLFSELGYDVEIIPEVSVLPPEIKKEKKPVKHDVEEKPVIKPKLEPQYKHWVKKIPVITVMGHVDHGKTTLLDTIKKTNVAGTEFGAITQHIGAYKVKTPHGDITFIDTPGHAAFTTLRARGAKVTDIAVIVVSGDEGVMPQTIEAINHVKEANVPIIVAVNKIDLPHCNPQKVRQQFSDLGIVANDWGGQTEFVDISARNNINVDKLLETILIHSELMDLKAPIDTSAEATVIETKLDPKRGITGTVIVSKGKLKIGDAFICGLSYGKVRAMFNDSGERIDELNPGEPAEILGFAVTPQAGDVLQVVKDGKEAKKFFDKENEKIKIEATKVKRQVSIEDIISGKNKIFSIILKTDTQGSVEAIKKMLDLTKEEIKNNPDIPELKIVQATVGEISESDVLLASASNSIIIGFNIRPTVQAIKTAKHEGVEIKTYRIIYELIDDIKKILQRMEIKKEKEEFLGRARVKKVFDISKVGKIAGCIVEEGKIVRNAKVRVLRDNVIITETKISSLKHLKDDVKEILKDYECGIGLENFGDIKENDIIECFQLIPATFVEEKVTR